MDDTEYMVTTLDNPWNPFTQFDAWYAEDIRLGHDTCGALARLSATGLNLFEDENAPILNSAIEDLLNADPYGIWIRVSRESFDKIKDRIGRTTNKALEIPK